MTIGAVVLPRNRFVRIEWGIEVTHENGAELTGTVPAKANESVALIRYENQRSFFSPHEPYTAVCFRKNISAVVVNQNLRIKIRKL